MNNLKNWLAIVNPRAGGLRSEKRRSRIVDQIRRLGIPIVMTEYAGHASALAGAAAKCDGVLVAGGDGTLLEVLNAIQYKRLAILPCGRGNSLARDLGLYPMERAFGALESGRFAQVDLMEAAFADHLGRRFEVLSASTIAMGYPTAVAQIADSRFRWLGQYCYAAAALGLAPKPMEVRTADGNYQLTGFVANNTRHMGNFVALPDARCHDGRFDVMEMSAGFFRQSLHNVSALSQWHFCSPAKLGPATEISLTMPDPQDLLVDGEIFPDIAWLRVSLQKGAMQIAVPSSGMELLQ